MPLLNFSIFGDELCFGHYRLCTLPAMNLLPSTVREELEYALECANARRGPDDDAQFQTPPD